MDTGGMLRKHPRAQEWQTDEKALVGYGHMCSNGKDGSMFGEEGAGRGAVEHEDQVSGGLVAPGITLCVWCHSGEPHWHLAIIMIDGYWWV